MLPIVNPPRLLAARVASSLLSGGGGGAAAANAAAALPPFARAFLGTQEPTVPPTSEEAIKNAPDAPPTEEQIPGPTNLEEDLKYASADANESHVGRAAQAEDAGDILTGEARERAKAMTSEAEAEAMDFEASGAESLKRAAHKAYNKAADVVTGMFGDPDAGRK